MRRLRAWARESVRQMPAEESSTISADAAQIATDKGSNLGGTDSSLGWHLKDAGGQASHALLAGHDFET